MSEFEARMPGRACACIGIVIIGRNEGERLHQCLCSVNADCRTVVYVDSGSTDDSVSWARSLGVQVESLDMTQPFTAARARNLGWHRLVEATPDVQFVQFVDGDCEVDAQWITTARAFLEQRPDVAAVCGRRRERHPERSVYNRLCDFEWNTPVGEAKACGGDVLMRLSALQQAAGFRDEFIAGEEPELCLRLRRFGWKVWRLDAEMTLHDAAMTRFSQWWKRSMRAGFAFAEGSALHGAAPERHWVREARSARIWGLLIPIAIVGALGVFGPRAALALLVYPLQVSRLSLRGVGAWRARAERATFLVLGKFPEVLGQMKYLGSRIAGREAGLIEYK